MLSFWILRSLPQQLHMQNNRRGYKDINLLGFKLLNPGRLLFTFSCSGGVYFKLFQNIVAGTALDAKVDAMIVKRLSQGPDHPVSLYFPEGAYLRDSSFTLGGINHGCR